MSVADNLDIPVGKKHSVRTGFEIETGNYIGDELRNFKGTFTFPTLLAYETHRPNNYTIRQATRTSVPQHRGRALHPGRLPFKKNLLLSFGARTRRRPSSTTR